MQYQLLITGLDFEKFSVLKAFTYWFTAYYCKTPTSVYSSLF
jgi:hypothetical protein